MAIESLLEVTPSDQIFDLGEEVGRPQIPMVGDDEYGFRVDDNCLSLVKLRIAGRRGTEKDGEYNNKVIKYKKWEPVDKYPTTYWTAMKTYMDYVNLQKMKNGKDLGINDIKKINLDTQKVICDTLRSCVELGDIKDVCGLLDAKQKLLEDVKGLRKDISESEKLLAEIQMFHAAIKEKYKIIVEVDKPKKHKIKEED